MSDINTNRNINPCNVNVEDILNGGLGIECWLDLDNETKLFRLKICRAETREPFFYIAVGSQAATDFMDFNDLIAGYTKIIRDLKEKNDRLEGAISDLEFKYEKK